MFLIGDDRAVDGMLPGVRDGVLKSWTRTRVPIFGTRDSTRTRALIDATWTREFSRMMTWTRTRELSRTLSLMSSILACAPAARRVHVLGPAIPV